MEVLIRVGILNSFKLNKKNIGLVENNQNNLPKASCHCWWVMIFMSLTRYFFSVPKKISDAFFTYDSAKVLGQLWKCPNRVKTVLKTMQIYKIHEYDHKKLKVPFDLLGNVDLVFSSPFLSNVFNFVLSARTACVLPWSNFSSVEDHSAQKGLFW